LPGQDESGEPSPPPSSQQRQPNGLRQKSRFIWHHPAGREQHQFLHQGWLGAGKFERTPCALRKPNKNGLRRMQPLQHIHQPFCIGRASPIRAVRRAFARFAQQVYGIHAIVLGVGPYITHPSGRVGARAMQQNERGRGDRTAGNDERGAVAGRQIERLTRHRPTRQLGVVLGLNKLFAGSRSIDGCLVHSHSTTARSTDAGVRRLRISLGALEPATHGSLVRGILRREACLQVPLLSRDHDERHDGHRGKKRDN
jgi:hypothetical protein